MSEEAGRLIAVLLNFAASKATKVQYTAFWALKDYILLTDNLMPDISQIILAFLSGCLTKTSCSCSNKNHKIQAQCIDAISFMVTHRLVYKSKLTARMNEH